MPTYTVKQGDCISSIAEETGFFWETIWNHPDNANLKRLRKNANALLPGDEIFIPAKRLKEEPCATANRHRFRIRGIPVKLNLRLLDSQDQPRANIPYTLTVDGKVKSGSTDRDGKISEEIKPNSKKARLVIQQPNTPEEQYDFHLGHMNPTDDVAGWQSRLQNLGYLRDISGQLDEPAVEALKRFQTSAGLTETGEIDSATQAKLEQLHGG